MRLSDSQKNVIERLFLIEQESIAEKLGLIKRNAVVIDNDLMIKAIGLIDILSREDNEESIRIAITLCAILWSYKRPEWTGLKDFLILVLSRIGYAPSAIMVDSKYDFSENKHSGLHSWITELSVSLHQLKYEIEIKDQNFLLTSFQKNVWDKINKNKILGVSAPTSAGKSFIILLKAIDLLLEKEGTIIYIVPTLSLVSQVSNDFRKILNQFELKEYEVLNSYYQDFGDSKKIFVLTQEKAIAAFAQQDNPFSNIRLLVVDEIQNVERVAQEDDERAKILYDTLIEFRHQEEPDKIIIAGPRVERIENLAVEIFGEEAKEEETKNSPVINITYSIAKKGKRYMFKQYSGVLDYPNELKIENVEMINGFGQRLYNDNFHQYLKCILHGLGDSAINIIFSPKPNQARKTAEAIYDIFSEQSDTKLTSLKNYLKQTVHAEYSLCKTLERGVAYHHGRLPHHVRRVLEKAVTEKLITNIVCTTTLMQGMNLPAQNVIIRNPNLFVKQTQGSPKLSDYEIANLRGRAGRLLKDFIGRTYILDESSFEVDNEQSLFEDTTKELHAGYKEKYEHFKTDILSSLVNDETPTSENKKYSYFLPYIRQLILKYGKGAKKRLEIVGINLPANEFAEVEKSIRKLVIPKEICMKNRYWDPIDLNQIYIMKNRPSIPLSVKDNNISDKLKNAIMFMKKSAPYYFYKYFKTEDIEGFDIIYSLCINAENWLKETPISDILNTKYHDDAEKIEKTISILQGKISYDLPMLLKPLYDMQTHSVEKKENMFLTFIEMGAYKPVTRKLIEMGIPRETAIYLNCKYLSDLNFVAEDLDKKVIDRVNIIYKKLNYWIQIQLESIIKA